MLPRVLYAKTNYYPGGACIFYLHLILPALEPLKIVAPSRCTFSPCPGKRFRLHQSVSKSLRDTTHAQIEVHRYQCLTCQRTFRVYPRGATREQISQRVKCLAIVLYFLGLSYGAVSQTLKLLRTSLCKSAVYEAVRLAHQRFPSLQRVSLFEDLRTYPLHKEYVRVKCCNKWLVLRATESATAVLTLECDHLTIEEVRGIARSIEVIATSLGVQLVLKETGEKSREEFCYENSLPRQKPSQKQNTQRILERVQAIEMNHFDESLSSLCIAPQQFKHDLACLKDFVKGPSPAQRSELEAAYMRYLAAPPPRKGERASVAYRFRLLLLNCWDENSGSRRETGAVHDTLSS